MAFAPLFGTLKHAVRTLVPLPAMPTGVYIRSLARDTVAAVLGRHEPLIPPTRLMFDGPPDVSTFKENGEEFFEYFVNRCGLAPHESILDVGCGIGRKTVPLTRYLNEQGRYEGFDIVQTGINWCTKVISSRHPNFHFQHADVFNGRYNPRGTYRPSEYEFPFTAESFDFAFASSVFTHMLPDGVENYVAQVARVLRAGGRCLITFLLWNNESAALNAAAKSTLDFPYDGGVYRMMLQDRPEDAVCYDEAFVLALYAKHGLELQRPIQYGSWCGRQHFTSYQDIIIAIKRAPRIVARSR